MLNRTISLYRSAYGGLSPSTWFLSLVMLVNRSGTMVVPFLTIYLTRPSMGYSIGQAGAVLGIFGLGAVCGGFAGGRLTDRFGFHRVQLFTLTGGGFLFLVLGQMRTYASICVVTFLLSLINESFRPANSTAIAHYSGEDNRTRSYSLNRLAINLGWALGAGMGGILASINYHLLFWVDGLTNIGAAMLLWYFLSPSSNEATPAGQRDGRPNSLSPYRDRIYLVFIGLTILFALCFFQLSTTLPLYYKRVMRFPEYLIGMLMSLNGLIIVAFEMVLVFKMERRKDLLYFIRYGVLCVAISWLLLNILPLAIGSIIFSMVMLTLGEIFSMPFMSSFMISRTQAGNRGQYAGLYTIAWSIAQVFGPWGGAEIIEHSGFRALWWSAGGLCLLAAGAFSLLRQQILASPEWSR